ncbi:MAG TPA: protein phosphatase CheZ [Terriglobales bacterium]|nr:protein phosphatase CheZ [Terriglobales bacterium]
MTIAVPPELVARLSALRSRGQSYSREEITEIVTGLLGTLDGDLSDVNLKLYSELEDLAQYILAAKKEIASLLPDDITSEHLPTATDELDAIVGATEEATNGILQAVEAIESLTGEMDPAVAEKISEAVTQVYESCNFQDITGQRITKVVKALKHIETKVDALVAAFGDEIQKYRELHPQQAEEKEPQTTDAALLNGPQMPDDAAKQAEIDALLASFD